VLADAGVSLDEADALCEESRRLTVPDDVINQILWRTVRAKLLRHAGHPKQALPYAEEALAYAEQTDWPNHQADALALTASLYAQTGSPARADELRSRALVLYRQKGNVAGERNLMGEDAARGRQS
jgi:ATP/maltotriose-dependent transcriptional regulator MalT